MKLDERYPLGAIVGLDVARRALMLLAIDPRLKGILISSGAGSAKSTLARAARDVFSAASGGVAPFVETPVNTTPDMLLAGLDVERTISRSAKVIQKGLLAQADGGLLYADGINLLDDSSINHIAAALESGVVMAEREGVSARLPARFALVGTFDPAEGAVSPMLKDRVGLIVEADADVHSREREEIIRRALSFDEDPSGFIKEYSAETKRAVDAVERAKSLLPRVRVGRGDILRLSEVALRMGVEGNRADIFAVRAMRASAALDGRDRVGEQDLLAAINLVLAPRSSEANVPPEHPQQQKLSQEPDGPGHEAGDRRDLDAAGEKSRSRNAAEFMIEPRDAVSPEIRASSNRNKARAIMPGKRAESKNGRAGRYVSSTATRSADARVAVDATLRAAAPFQKSRRALSGRTGKGAVKIMPPDLRYKQYRRRNGMLFVFVVDASGSMAANRMAQAKGAVVRLLEKAYLHRDQVALISFQRSAARLLLQPTRSVTTAKHMVEAMPAGGATPLAAGLVRGLEAVRLARLQGAGKAMLILLTDGRANMALNNQAGGADPRAAIMGELKEVGLALARESVASIIIDTKSSFLAWGEARGVADAIGAQYIYLPRADAAGVFDAVRSVAGRLRH